MNEYATKIRTFKQIDAFTDKPCLGNPVAVILEGKGLTTEQMQRLAAWTNLSETVFMLPSSGADYELRIFTPHRELDFAGHPTIGAAHAAIEAGLVRGNKPFYQRCKAGMYELWSTNKIIWVRTPKPKRLNAHPSVQEIRGALVGCVPFDPVIYNSGPIWIVARLATAEELNGAWFNARELVDLSNSYKATGIVLYSFRPEGGIEARTFAPAVGIYEDPVCGSGNLAIAAHLEETGHIKRFGNVYEARQGKKLGRDGKLYLSVNESSIELGGQAVTVFEGYAFL
jgi:PhzF family phenazine biosynthesis protein